MNLHETLLDKARQEKLAHFYILEASQQDPEAPKHLQDFVHAFIRDYYQQVEGQKQRPTQLLDYPDVFILGNLTETEDPEDAFFSVAESETLSRFFEFKPVQGKRKFAVITEAHRINTIVANKWLKLLEEPHGVSTIFLLNPKRQKLLDTIHSRAIHLRLPVKFQETAQNEWLELLQDAQKLSLSSFLEKYTKHDRELNFWMEELIRWESEESQGPSHKEALKTWLTSYKEMDVFHQPTATKWTLFYSYLHEHVLPRLSR